MLAGIYALLVVGVLLIGLSGELKEPLIWEGVGSLFVMLFPLSYLILRLPFGPFSIGCTILIGGLFYFAFGYLFERCVLGPQPRAQSPERS